jgi:TonB family protein
MRADALSLEVPVKVHGSRVKEVVRGVAPSTEPFEEQTSTMIVFPQGGVLRMSTQANVGQMLVLTNLKTKQDAICRVVKVRANSNLQSYVEVEFTSRQNGYWGVHFPSEGSASSSKPASQLAPSAAPVETKEKSVAPPHAPQSVPRSNLESAPSWKKPQTPVALPETPWGSMNRAPSATTGSRDSETPAIPPVPPRPTAKPESSFISIGTQEDVQVSASATLTKKPGPSFENLSTPAMQEAAKLSVETAMPAVPPSAAIPAPEQPFISELRSDSAPPQVQSAASKPDSSSDIDVALEAALRANPVLHASDSAIAEPSANESQESAAARESSFGTLGGSFGTAAARSAEHETASRSDSPAASATVRRPNWVSIAAFATVVVAIAGFGISYFRSHAGANKAAVAVPAAAPSNTTPSEIPASASAITSPAAVAPASSVPVAVPSSSGASAAPNSAQPRAAKQPASSVTKSMMSQSISAHPVSSQRAGTADSGAAPALDASSANTAENVAVPGVAPATSFSVPMPELRAQGSVKVGGEVTQPRLISSVAPVYPTVAKQMNVQGDVVVRATIDQKGNVAEMQVVSGPAVLRPAALAALHGWRYEPSKLDGQPISAQMLVTIKFHF